MIIQNIQENYFQGTDYHSPAFNTRKDLSQFNKKYDFFITIMSNYILQKTMACNYLIISLVQNQIWYPKFGYQLWCLLYDICNIFKNIFNVALIMMWQSIVVVGFPTTELWALENLEGYQYLVIFQKINLQGRNKLIALSMSANEFTDMPPTTGCKIPQSLVC